MTGKVTMYPTLIPQQIQLRGKTKATIEKISSGFLIKIWVDDYLRYGIEVEEIYNEDPDGDTHT